MLDMKERVDKFLTRLEDEICARTDIDDFDEFMTALAAEMGHRYSPAVIVLHENVLSPEQREKLQKMLATAHIGLTIDRPIVLPASPTYDEIATTATRAWLEDHGSLVGDDKRSLTKVIVAISKMLR